VNDDNSVPAVLRRPRRCDHGSGPGAAELAPLAIRVLWNRLRRVGAPMDEMTRHERAPVDPRG
jgi:hypothetical protein